MAQATRKGEIVTLSLDEAKSEAEVVRMALSVYMEYLQARIAENPPDVTLRGPDGEVTVEASNSLIECFTIAKHVDKALESVGVDR